MAQHMTWAEMKKTYPDQWVAVANYTSNDAGGVDGEVLYHSGNKEEFYMELKKLLPRYGDVAMEFTGTRIKNPDVPQLWQISPTASTNG